MNGRKNGKGIFRTKDKVLEATFDNDKPIGIGKIKDLNTELERKVDWSKEKWNF